MIDYTVLNVQFAKNMLFFILFLVKIKKLARERIHLSHIEQLESHECVSPPLTVMEGMLQKKLFIYF